MGEKRYNRKQLFDMYIERCQERGRAINSKDIQRDIKMPNYNTYLDYGITIDDLYEATELPVENINPYTKEYLLRLYLQECQKENRILNSHEIRNNFNLPDVKTYQKRDLYMDQLKKIAKKKLEGG